METDSGLPYMSTPVVYSDDRDRNVGVSHTNQHAKGRFSKNVSYDDLLEVLVADLRGEHFSDHKISRLLKPIRTYVDCQIGENPLVQPEEFSALLVELEVDLREDLSERKVTRFLRELKALVN